MLQHGFPFGKEHRRLWLRGMTGDWSSPGGCVQEAYSRGLPSVCCEVRSSANITGVHQESEGRNALERCTGKMHVTWLSNKLPYHVEILCKRLHLVLERVLFPSTTKGRLEDVVDLWKDGQVNLFDDAWAGIQHLSRSPNPHKKAQAHCRERRSA